MTDAMIKRAMLDNERDVLRYVKKHGVVFGTPSSRPWQNAVIRVSEKGKLRYSRRHSGYVLKGEKS